MSSARSSPFRPLDFVSARQGRAGASHLGLGHFPRSLGIQLTQWGVAMSPKRSQVSDTQAFYWPWPRPSPRMRRFCCVQGDHRVQRLVPRGCQVDPGQRRSGLRPQDRTTNCAALRANLQQRSLALQHVYHLNTFLSLLCNYYLY